MKFEKNEMILILGGSRGLGRALGLEIEKSSTQVISRSRKSVPSFDFSKTEDWSKIVSDIRAIKPQRVIYCAGGGPYGPFSRFEWKDHAWSWKVNFEFPAYLLHDFLKMPIAELKQLVLIGSKVAESAPDPGAASYAAGKHALKGLISTVIADKEPTFDLRLLSPGYMETDLLPIGSRPRRQGLAKPVEQVASRMIQSITDSDLRHSHQCFD